MMYGVIDNFINADVAFNRDTSLINQPVARVAYRFPIPTLNPLANHKSNP